MKYLLVDNRKNHHKKAYTAVITCTCLSMLLAGVTLAALFARYQLFPFGENSVSWGDMEQQVIPLLLDFKDILEGKSSMFINLQNAGGMSFWGVFFFFLSSPFSFFVLIIEKTQIYGLVNILTAIKIIVAAGSAALFFSYRNSEFSVEEGGLPSAHADQNRLVAISLSLSYAFCGYALLYYQNLLWLDLLYMFPLTMIGFRRILEERKPILFCFCLTLTLAMSYYLSYMVMLFLLFATAVFCIMVVQDREKKRDVAVQIGVSALLALGFTAVIWIPSLIQYLGSARTQDIFKNLSNSNFFAPLLTTLPMLLCTACIGVVPFLFFRKKTSRAQQALFILFIMMIIPVFIEPINKMWHIGSYQAFPVRYGYISVFLGLWLLRELTMKSKGVLLSKKWEKGLSILFVLMTIGYCIILNRFYFQEITSYTKSLWVSHESFLHLLPVFALSIIAFAILFGLSACAEGKPPTSKRSVGGGFPLGGGVEAPSSTLNSLRNNSGKRLTSAFILILTLSLNFFYSSVFIGSAASDKSLEDCVISQDAEEGNSLYRTKTNSSRVVNMTGARGFPTIDHYTSLTGKQFYESMRRMGYSGYWMEISSYGGTAVSDLLLSNKYTILETGEIAQISKNADIGMIFPSGMLPRHLAGEDRIDVQEELYRSIMGESGFIRYEGQTNHENDKIVFGITIQAEEILYLDIFKNISNRLSEDYYNSAEIYVNGQCYKEQYPSQKNNGILNLGTYENEKVIVEVSLYKEIDWEMITLAGLPTKRLKSLYSNIREADTSIDGNTITFTAEAKRDEALYLSIPLQGETSIHVNGRKSEAETVLDCFYEIQLDEGENHITVSSIPKGMRMGAIISGASLCILLLSILVRNTRIYHLAKNIFQSSAYPVLLITAAIAGIMIYIIPIILWALPFQ